MKKTLTVSFIITLLLGTIIKSKSQQTPEMVADSFFYYFKNKNIESAIKYIFSTNKYLVQFPEVVNTLKAKFDKALPILGNFHQYQLYLKKEITNNFVQLGYLMIFDRQPIKILFLLYKPVDKWQIQDMRFDDKLEDVIENTPNKISY
ncbi:MAG: hypothetical protein N3A01_00680 [Bacteroidales bacterium]|nr:hypothetical protein [Bacteroidales bacterium]